MDYYEKCWQYQNIDYRYFDYIYIYIYIISNILSPLIKHWFCGDHFPLLSTPPAVTNLFNLHGRPSVLWGPDLQRAGFWRAWGRIEGLQERPPFMTTHN
jgi:hypothetical protein